jgi:hypothetical protein
LVEPWKLLEEWSNAYTYRKNQVRNFYSLKSIPEIEADLARVCREKGIEYALTGFSGAARFAPAVRYNRAMAYAATMPEDLDLREVESGANVMLLGPYDEGGVFYGTQVIDDIRIVSPLQIYLDLKGYKGRGEEAAEVLLRDVIKPNGQKRNDNMITRRDYTAEGVEAARSVLVELVHLLGEYKDDIVLIDGWVRRSCCPITPALMSEAWTLMLH